MSFVFQIEYGWAAKPIQDQLDGYGIEGIPAHMLSKWQKIADSLLVVSLHSILPPSTIAKGRNRLARQIEKYLVDEGFMVPAEARKANPKGE